MGELNSLGGDPGRSCQSEHHQPSNSRGRNVKARGAREMKTIHGNQVAKCKRKGAEVSSADQIMIEYK